MLSPLASHVDPSVWELVGTGAQLFLNRVDPRISARRTRDYVETLWCLPKLHALDTDILMVLKLSRHMEDSALVQTSIVISLGTLSMTESPLITEHERHVQTSQMRYSKLAIHAGNTFSEI